MNCTGTRFLNTDNLGSIIAAADCSGNRTNIDAYDEYGVPGAGNWGRYQYTGQAWIADLGLYYYKSRFYSPTLGRFMQTDPVGYADGPNGYAYVGNNPVNGIDPSGMATCKDCKKVDGGGDTTATVEELVVVAAKREKGQDPTILRINITGAVVQNGLRLLLADLVPYRPQQAKPTCNTVLPNGKTIGQVVQDSIANIEGAAGPYDMGGVGEFGAFIATVQSGGPIDFKNNFKGRADAKSLGDAGNFAYGAIASGIGYSQIFAQYLAGAYAARHGKANANNPGFEDNSAAKNLPSGYATGGCPK